jgi:hypothetical protein
MQVSRLVIKLSVEMSFQIHYFNETTNFFNDLCRVVRSYAIIFCVKRITYTKLTWYLPAKLSNILKHARIKQENLIARWGINKTRCQQIYVI